MVFPSWLSRLDAGTKPTRPSRRRFAFTPRLERLETRVLLSGNPPLSFDAGSGRLTIGGDDGNNAVRQAVSAAGFVEVEIDGRLFSANVASAAYDARLAGATAQTLRAVRLDGGAGDDVLTLGDQRLAHGLTATADDHLAVAGRIVVAEQVSLTGSVVIVTGSIQAGGIAVQAGNVLHAGSLAADAGGTVAVHFTGHYVETTAALTAAAGGRLVIDGGATGTVYASGRHDAAGLVGGQIDVFGREVRLLGATLDASGQYGGGRIRVGGDFQGLNPAVVNAVTTLLGPTTDLRADAQLTGPGGRIIVWAEQTTEFYGEVSARGGPAGGAGGFIEVSGKGELTYGGHADAGASAGAAGTVLLDPKNLVIDSIASFIAKFNLIDPTPNNGDQFGATVVALSTGNIVVTDPNDDFGALNAGAFHLFNGATGALISSLYGSTASDQVGISGVTVLTNGNYVVRSQLWDNVGAGAANAGAVTWGNGTTGISGTVSDTNSLVGSTANDQVGSGGVTALTNGNYVVRSQLWDNVGAGAVDAGAVTWGNGTTGISGTASDTNSLVGSTASDGVGSSGVTALTNGNYVVRSSVWDNVGAGAANAGAVTWGDGTTGISGVVSDTNSLVGSTLSDQVGGSGVTALTNGNYVVSSSLWDGAAANTGAVTWGNGTTGISGVVSDTNSLVGSTDSDNVGSTGVTALTNGNYVVSSQNWDNVGAGAVNAGAVTWGDGTTGISGVVSDTNSLVGSTASDRVGNGGVTALSNGNYVVISFEWNAVGAADAGAVTWGDGTTGVSGVVSAANSLIGSSVNDQVGTGGVTALTNGNYVVRTLNWDAVGAIDAGAVTWSDGLGGTVGVVSAANSLVGSSASDQVGSSGVTALTNGNYVVSSGNWDAAGAANAGAVTWGNGLGGTVGVVSTANSLVGSTASDQVGISGVTALTNGNFVVRSGNWAGFRGAVTWGNGLGGTVGVVSTANSLVGSTANDEVGIGVTALTNGNYVVRSSGWDNGGAVDAGAVTWGSGLGGTVGVVSAANSLVGSFPNESIGNGGVTALANDNYVVISTLGAGFGAATFGDGTTGVRGVISAANSHIGQTGNAGLGAIIVDNVNGSYLVRFVTELNGRVTVGFQSLDEIPYGLSAAESSSMHPDSLTQTLNTGTALVLQASNDITVNSAIVISNPAGAGGDLTLQAGRSILINANITTDDGNLTLIANDLLASGVVDAQRDAGAAVISMVSGTALTAGSGTVLIDLRSGAGKTNATSGDVILETIAAATVSITQAGPTAGSDVLVGSVMAAGTLTVVSAGAIEEQGSDAAADLVAATLNLTAAAGIGAAAALEIEAIDVAASVTGAGSIDLRDTAGGVFVSSATTVNGAITLAAELGNLMVNTVTAGGSGAVDLSTVSFGTVQVGAVSTGGSLGIASAGAVILDASPNVGGATTVNAGGALSVAADFTAQAAVNLTASGIAFLGDLDVGDQTVTLTTGGSSAQLGGVTTVGPTGQLIAANGVTVGSGGVLSGTGLVDVGLGGAGLKVLASGTVAPGASPGTLTVDGDLVLNTGAILAIEINGTGAGLFDELVVNGAVNLGGATLAVILGYTPAVNDSFQIITNDLADSVTGTFIAAGSLTVGSTTFSISYTAGSNNDVVLTVAPLEGGPTPAATANGDVFSLPEDSLATALGVMGNDLGSGLTITAITQAVNGTVVITGGGTGLTYQPNLNFTGVDSFTYTITDSLANTSTATVIVAVTPVNDAPVLAAPASAVMRANTVTAIAGITVNDIDAGSNPLQAIVSALTGALTLGSVAGLTFAAGDGTNDTTMTFTGTLASINNALAGLKYRGPADASAADTVTVTINDQGHTGGGNQSDAKNIAINPAFNTVQVLADPFKAGTKALVINGTAGNDVITITPVGNANTTRTFRVKINGGPLQTFAGVTGRILVYGHAGNDTITVNALIVRPTLLVGGDGNDSLTGARGADTMTGGLGDDTFKGGPGVDRLLETGDVDMTLAQGTTAVNGSLTGGLGTDVLFRNTIETARLTGGASANVLNAAAFSGRTTLLGGDGGDTLTGGSNSDVLLGGDGDDSLAGGNGRDLLIGGLGLDELNGDAGDDLLIDGTTAFDANLAALDLVMAEWTRTDATYAVRVKHLLGTMAGTKSGTVRLKNTTVFTDGLANSLTGAANLDWFFQGAATLVNDPNTGGPETVTPLP